MSIDRFATTAYSNHGWSVHGDTLGSRLLSCFGLNWGMGPLIYLLTCERKGRVTDTIPCVACMVLVLSVWVDAYVHYVCVHICWCVWSAKGSNCPLIRFRWGQRPCCFSRSKPSREMCCGEGLRCAKKNNYPNTLSHRHPSTPLTNTSVASVNWPFFFLHHWSSR